MQEHAFGQTDVSNSQLHMFRCVIAMAHADGIITPQEHDYLTAFIEKLPFNADQKQILLSDLETKQDAAELVSHIDTPKHRGQVVYFARLLAYKDGHLHPKEDDFLKYLHLSVSTDADIEGIRASIKAESERELVLNDIKTDSARPENGLSGLLDRFLLFCGIDVMDG